MIASRPASSVRSTMATASASTSAAASADDAGWLRMRSGSSAATSSATPTQSTSTPLGPGVAGQFGGQVAGQVPAVGRVAGDLDRAGVFAVQQPRRVRCRWSRWSPAADTAPADRPPPARSGPGRHRMATVHRSRSSDAVPRLLEIVRFAEVQGDVRRAEFDGGQPGHRPGGRRRGRRRAGAAPRRAFDGGGGGVADRGRRSSPPASAPVPGR